jgi:hypothetical protein
MIYELKIILTGTKPTIWRRIQVSSQWTFSDLHDILQILFEWEGEHLHIFEILRTNGKISSNQAITIGPTEHIPVEVNYAEVDCKLENWLTTEKDICRYIYDFGNYWQHEILLERIIHVGDTSYFYPVCRKVVGEAPTDYEIEVRKDGDEELKSVINQQLKHLWRKLN